MHAKDFRFLSLRFLPVVVIIVLPTNEIKYANSILKIKTSIKNGITLLNMSQSLSKKEGVANKKENETVIKGIRNG